MKKALVLGTNAGQADLIRYLAETNWEVHSCGYKMAGPGCSLAHRFHLVDTNDEDSVLKLAKHIGADIVYTVSSDSAIITATKVSEILGLPVLLNSDLVDLFNRKDRLRKYLNEQGISNVEYATISMPEEAGHWRSMPCVVKPTDSQGQRGVQLIEDTVHLKNAVATALAPSKNHTAIIEEYLDGVEISINMVLQNGRILINEVTERIVHGRQNFGLPKGHCIPPRNVNEKDIDEARRIAAQLVERLAIKDAVLYFQMKVTDKGVKILEVAPRLDGCHIWRLLKQAKGYDLRECAIDLLLGKSIVLPEKARTEEPYSLFFHQMSTGEKFTTRNLTLPEGLLFNEFRYQENDIVEPVNGSFEVVGYYIIRG